MSCAVSSRAWNGESCEPEWIERVWREELQPFLDALFASRPLPPSTSREELYRCVEDVCVEGYARWLYERVLDSVAGFAVLATRALATRAAEASSEDSNVLCAFASAWGAHALHSAEACAVFLYLDRAYCANAPGVASLRAAGTCAFRLALKKESALEQTLVSALRREVSRERAGGQVNVASVAACCRALASLKLYAQEGFCETCFEEVLLRDAREHYAGQGRRLTATACDESDAAQHALRYVDAVSKCFADAERAVSEYLETSTLPKLVSTIERELVQPHVAAVCVQGFDALMTGARAGDARCASALERLYEFLSRVDLASVAKKATRAYALREARAALKEACSGGGLGCASKRPRSGEGEEALESPRTGGSKSESLVAEAVVVRLVALREDVLAVCATRLSRCADETEWAQLALKDALEEALNEEQFGAKFGELLALYCDSALSCGTAHASRPLEDALLLFRYAQHKDVFEAFYRAHLAHRLLADALVFFPQSGCKRSSSGGVDGEPAPGPLMLETERGAIARLERECGNSYVSKLEGMCKDLELAKSLADAYARHSAGHGHALELCPTVLTTGYWPATAATRLTLPAPLEHHKQLFEKFYSAKFQGRRVEWKHGLERCVVSQRLAAGKKMDLDATLAQTAVLLCFNHSCEPLGVSELKKATGLDEDELRRVLHSLCASSKFRILAKHASESSGEAYTANEAFATTRRRGKLPAPKIPEKRRADGDARDKVLQAVARDRDYAVDAMIVRIMKARKTLPHNRLLSELMTTLKHPAGAADIKKRIEILIEREYLERDLHDTQCYNYLA